MHEAFFFGPEDRQLFAVYHPSSNSQARVLTVICPPLFAELNRSHFLLRRLAIALVDKGQHVLRFDFSGTGDSFGSLAGISRREWIEDVAEAVQEGLDLSGCRLVRILGVRASALFVCKATSEFETFDRIVLWDPVRSGSSYIGSIERQTRYILGQHQFMGQRERRDAMHAGCMYDLSGEILDCFRALDESVYLGIHPDKLRVLCTSSSECLGLTGINENVVNADVAWETNVDDTIVSKPVLEELVSLLTES